MAFLQDAISPQGFECKLAYHRVECVKLENKKTLQFRLRVYKTISNSFFDDKEYSCDYDLESEHNVLKQAYFFLKSLPEYKNSVDS